MTRRTYRPPQVRTEESPWLLLSRLNVSREEAEQLAGMPPGTYLHDDWQRLQGEARALAMGWLVRLVSLWSRARHTFGEARAQGWMVEPHRALGDARPIDRLATEPQALGVLDLLGGLEHDSP